MMEKLGILSKTQIGKWNEKSKNKEGFTDEHGRCNKTKFERMEEGNAYLKAQVEYLKKRNPNLHGEGSWISKLGASPFKK
ncbi:transposase [Paenibacillus sp. KACC 21273]|uniref:transposase n=1 Tax=Paenibacillus sp. KACC 21273 TaxID=3025665 RepID=UPI0023664A83|nr:transposase [Paenibacillus sp. KACC 21273]WDF52833.1 transposase [Paenibacillus sp. KACC 21273]